MTSESMFDFYCLNVDCGRAQLDDDEVVWQGDDVPTCPACGEPCAEVY